MSPYSPQTWADGNPAFPASAARLTHIESGLTDLDTSTNPSLAWGAARNLGDRALDRVNAFDNLSSSERTDARGYTGSIDVTAKIQSIADYLAGQNGGVIELPPCKVQLNGLVLGNGVSLIAEGHRGQGASPGLSNLHPYQIVSTGGWAIDTPSSASYGQVVAGLKIIGPGAVSGSGAIRHRNTSRAAVIGCYIQNFNEWGILQVAGGQSVYDNNVVWGVLLDRTRAIDQTTMPHGAIELRGNDNWVRGGEYTTSQAASFGATPISSTLQAGSTSTTAVLAAGSSSADNFYAGWIIELTGGTGSGQINYCSSYTGASTTMTLNTSWFQTPDATSTYTITPIRCCAGVFKASDQWVIGGIYETSEAGIYAKGATGAGARFTSVITDQNSGPGWVINNGQCHIDSTCHGNRSSTAVNGAYDDFLIIGAGSGSYLDSPKTGSLASDTNQSRHGFHHALAPTGVDNTRAVIRVGTRIGSRRGNLVQIEQTGINAHAASVTLPDGTLILTSGTTQNLDGWKHVWFKSFTTTTITQFTNLIDGETYTMVANNGNVTLANNANIVLKGGTNLTLSTNTPVMFTALNAVLYQL